MDCFALRARNDGNFLVIARSAATKQSTYSRFKLLFKITLVMIEKTADQQMLYSAKSITKVIGNTSTSSKALPKQK